METKTNWLAIQPFLDALVECRGWEREKLTEAMELAYKAGRIDGQYDLATASLARLDTAKA